MVDSSVKDTLIRQMAVTGTVYLNNRKYWQWIRSVSITLAEQTSDVLVWPLFLGSDRVALATILLPTF